MLDAASCCLCAQRDECPFPSVVAGCGQERISSALKCRGSQPQLMLACYGPVHGARVEGSHLFLWDTHGIDVVCSQVSPPGSCISFFDENESWGATHIVWKQLLRCMRWTEVWAWSSLA